MSMRAAGQPSQFTDRDECSLPPAALCWAPQVDAPRHPPGVVRSPLQPEEVRGLTRSGELSRMLPSEMALLAHGWPRKAQQDAAAAAVNAVAARDIGGEDAQIVEEEYYLPGALYSSIDSLCCTTRG